MARAGSVDPRRDAEADTSAESQPVSPEDGPRLLFFSGGSALRDLCPELLRLTHRSFHVVTPFDSGGSSASLRESLGMPSVGDLRNRILALVDRSDPDSEALMRLCARRLPRDASVSACRREVLEIVEGNAPELDAVGAARGALLVRPLRRALEALGEGFDLRGASLGNLVLAGAYLDADRDLAAAADVLAVLVRARGFVRPVLDADYHLEARLADGRGLAGQHRVTGKESTPIDAPVAKLSVIAGLGDSTPVRPEAATEVLDWIRRAQLICFPMGSFYTSILANLLPVGVGSAIAAADCPKVFVPNLGEDPEQFGMSVCDAVVRLIETVRLDAGEETSVERILNRVLLDDGAGVYAAAIDPEAITRLGVEVERAPLVGSGSLRSIDPQRLATRLVGMALGR